MTIERKVSVNQIEITSSNFVQVRLTMELVEGDNVLSSQYHRFIITEDSPLDVMIAAVNQDLTSQGWPPVNAEQIARVKAFEDLARTYG